MIQRYLTAAFKCPHFILMILGGVSAIALVMALISQYGFNMHPCYLCLWQRAPYALVILLAVFGILGSKIMGQGYAVSHVVMCAIALFVNSGIAVYHVGVEQQWWGSSCTLPDLSNLSPEDMMAAIKSAPAVSCGDIQFELFGISMAGYNVIICVGLGVYALVAARIASKSKS